jgi:cardiolipin synthase
VAERYRPWLVAVVAALVVAAASLALGGTRAPSTRIAVPVRRIAPIPSAAAAGEVTSATTQLVFEPGAGASPWLAAIAQSHHELLVNEYLLTDTAFIDALGQAAHRGVRVEVLVDTKPYDGASAAIAAMHALSRQGVMVKAAPGRFEGSYSFDHAKYLVVDPGYADEEAILGSANATWSALEGSNAEDEVLTTDPRIVTALAGVFAADWSRHPAGSAPRRELVLAPGAGGSIVSLLDTTGPVAVTAEELGDDPSLLAAMAHKGSGMRLLIPRDASSSTLRRARRLSAAGVEVRMLAVPYLHAKLIVTSRAVFVGSENLSYVSLAHNREVGIELEGAALRREALAWFDRLFRQAVPLT